jgi:hypothetical protein
LLLSKLAAGRWPCKKIKILAFTVEFSWPLAKFTEIKTLAKKKPTASFGQRPAFTSFYCGV